MHFRYYLLAIVIIQLLSCAKVQNREIIISTPNETNYENIKNDIINTPSGTVNSSSENSNSDIIQTWRSNKYSAFISKVDNGIATWDENTRLIYYSIVIKEGDETIYFRDSSEHYFFKIADNKVSNDLLAIEYNPIDYSPGMGRSENGVIYYSLSNRSIVFSYYLECAAQDEESIKLDYVKESPTSIELGYQFMKKLGFPFYGVGSIVLTYEINDGVFKLKKYSENIQKADPSKDYGNGPPSLDFPIKVEYGYQGIIDLFNAKNVTNIFW
jgi:hypothetical protein